MKKERDNNSKINLSLSDGVPQVSFSSDKAAHSALITKKYSIADNDIVAYYDSAHKLVFVLDNTLDGRKPNVLLVINPVGDRKWDDILSNDFGVDLETVRPKKDNKYQKLDIEYNGLSVYSNLIKEFDSGHDLSSALADLSNFRNTAARRAASDRLEASEDIISKSRETISKTGETLRELQSRTKKLREKLSRQKKEIGKEPTKQSAAKILKTESQIDVVNEKLRRSKKRLKNAQRRLVAAEDDAKIARMILAQKEQLVQPMAVENKTEIEAKNMVDEVKPLFDQDPDILDEKIAFKPIDFKINQPEQIAPENISEPEPIVEVSESGFQPIDNVPASPLSFTPPSAQTPYDTEPEPVVEPIVAPHINVAPQQPASEPMQPSPVVAEPAPTPIPVEEVRPVSPITGMPAKPAPVDSRTGGKPTVLYYIMLLILIALSVFTLWLYQKNMGDVVPELVATSQPTVVMPVPEPVAESDLVKSPFIQAELTQPEPPLQPIVQEEPAVVIEAPALLEPEPVQYIEPEPVMPELEPQVEIQEDAIAEPVYRSHEPAVAPVVAPMPAPIVDKPAYDVSTDRTFVADEAYDTDYVEDDGYYDQGYDDQYTEHYEEQSGEYYDEQYEEYYE